MTEWSVRVAGLSGGIQQLEQCCGRVNHVKNNVAGICGSIRGTSPALAAIGTRLNTLTDTMAQYAQTMEALSGALGNCAQRYTDTETALAGLQTAAVPAVPSGGGTVPSPVPGPVERPDWLKSLFKVFAGTGLTGTTASWIYSMISNDMESVLPNAIKTIGKFFQKLAGKDAVPAGAATTTWGERFTSGFSDKLGGFSTLYKGIGTATAWISSLVGSVVSNYKEFGNFSPRFFAETGVETLVKVGEGAALGAVVAATFVGAPAWLIGAAAALGGVALDAGLNAWATAAHNGVETKWTEVVSDFICDTSGKIGDAVQKGWDALSNTVCSWFRPQAAGSW